MEIKITSFKKSKIRATQVLCFTGGLIAMPVEIGGFILGPMAFNGHDLVYEGPLPLPDIHSLAKQAGFYYVGAKEIHEDGGPERSQFWYPSVGEVRASEQSADSWAAIAAQARAAQDDEYSCIAKYLSISLRSAGWRLRDIGDLHHEQLRWALLRNRSSGERFANVALHDLYLAMHSFLTEICSARDYLVQIAARRVCAKRTIDGLARLQEWLKKGNNFYARDDAMIKMLIAAVGSEESPGWLAQLGEMRNMFIHRQPMAASSDSAALLFRRVAAGCGFIPIIRLSRYSRGEEFAESEDPFIAFLRFWIEFESLSQASVVLSRYTAEPPRFVVADE
ncbi:hypothetical protein [Xanthomonas sacchari]|uniref:hypothetical protein n=1 Tax=Xanthomonas sacchari TaxID=56458 RepID=UPI00225A1C3F|nr:hypothetical protein [Xanthomonas sacchari]